MSIDRYGNVSGALAGQRRIAKNSEPQIQELSGRQRFWRGGPPWRGGRLASTANGELVTGNPAVGLSRRETDISLRYDGSAQGDFLIARRFAVGFGVYASREYVKHHGAPHAIDRFDGHTLITFDDSPGHVAPARWQLRGGKGAKIAFRSNSLHARIAVATVGTGCILMPCILGDRHRDLVQVLSPHQVGSLELFVFINRRIQSSPRVRVTASFVIDLLKAEREALAGRASIPA